MKWIKRLVLVVVLLVVVVVGALYVYKDAVVKAGVITGGDMVLGQGSTHLSGASLKVFGGSLTLTGLKLDNPEGYKQPEFFQLKETDVNVALGTLMSEKVVVPEVTLDGLQVVAETSLEQGLPKLNLITIKKTVDASTGGSGGGSQPSSSGTSSGGGKKFVIEKLTVSNMKVTGALTMPGGASVPVDVPVPTFTLEGIGEKTNGVVLQQLVGIILDAILQKAIEGVGNVGGVSLDMFQGGADALKNIGAGVLQGGSDLGGGAGKAIEGILGGDKDKKDGDTSKSGDDSKSDDIGKTIEKGLGGLLGGNQDKKEEETKE